MSYLKTKYKNYNGEYEITFASKYYEKVKTVEKVCHALMDKVVKSTLDMEVVVRCRECKFGSWDSEPDDAMVCVRTNDGFWRSGNDFCSRGERKEGADNG